MQDKEFYRASAGGGEVWQILRTVSVAAALAAACGRSEPPTAHELPTRQIISTRAPTQTFVPNPITASEGAIARGAEVYAASCAACHGAEGQGAGLDVYHPPPPNMGVMNRPELTDQAVQRVLTSSSSSHPSPNLGGRSLTEEEFEDVIGFARSISPSLDDDLNFKCKDCHGIEMSDS